jgi:hypothetical protein
MALRGRASMIYYYSNRFYPSWILSIDLAKKYNITGEYITRLNYIGILV